ncbi:MAG TPA: sorbosone dehydrogenase family protein [Polyangiaceae bacterium]|nr:sorbosone dehydrogenase family protein [Polyangiaceae bacterium]
MQDLRPCSARCKYVRVDLPKSHLIASLFGALLTLGTPACSRGRDTARGSGDVSSRAVPSGASAGTDAAHPNAAADAAKLPLDRIQLPKGFRIAAYATGVEDARSLTLSPTGTLFVGTKSKGRVYAIPNRDRDTVGDRVIEIASDLNSPNGVAFRDGALYVAEIDRVLRFDRIEQQLEGSPKPTVVTDRYPKDEHHGWKYIAFGPDGKLYIPIGAPCNVCDKDADGYSNITRINPDGSGFEIIARGVRNSVGFDFQPGTGQLWFTENGRDMLGDDVPGDELNRLSRPGEDFGFPRCHAGTIQDPEFGKSADCTKYSAPVRVLGAHVAALGMKFYTGKQFPPEYHNQIFVAEHGSWNRSKKSGYRVMLAQLEGERVVAYKEFATGWLRDEIVKGRPVDVAVAPDGALLVSDDEANAIYRISYTG